MSHGADPWTSMAASATFVRKDFLQVMLAWLERQLVGDQYARLGQAGHSPERRIPLARVFVDLEAESGPGEKPIPDVVASILNASPAPLQPPAILANPAIRKRKRRAERSQFLIIGGPGQGKSTVGQFLCQLYRAAILEQHREALGADGQQALSEVLHQRAAAQLEITKSLFPIRIELARLASWLADQQYTGNLLSFLASEVYRHTKELVAPDDLHACLTAHPFVLVLDGLDEVPVSGGRRSMLQAVLEFRVQMAEAKGILVATTRPQGHGDEFADFHTMRLAALSPQRSLRYAELLVDSWFAQNLDGRDRVMERLRQAAADDATARLMRSPLQVTIMAALLDRAGAPPRERWNLFERYYNAIYEREQDKPNAAAELRDYKPNVDAIHRQVGLVLQAESERRGATEALLTRPRLQEIIEAQLASQKVVGRAELTNRLLRLATDRLVFLVEPQEGRFGFEIRSLQEFMAAEALRRGSDDDVRHRLLAIGNSAAWRNVLSFCLSHAMSDLSDWRQWITGSLLEQLDGSADESSRVVLAGTQLALDLLSDGGPLRDPICADPLIERALRLLFSGGLRRIHLSAVW